MENKNIQMIAIMEAFQQDFFDVGAKRNEKRQKAVRVFNTVIRRTNLIYSSLTIMAELMKVQFTKTHYKLGKVG